MARPRGKKNPPAFLGHLLINDNNLPQHQHPQSRCPLRTSPPAEVGTLAAAAAQSAQTCLPSPGTEFLESIKPPTDRKCIWCFPNPSRIQWKVEVNNLFTGSHLYNFKKLLMILNGIYWCISVGLKHWGKKIFWKMQNGLVLFPKLLALWLLVRMQLHEAGVGAASLSPSSWAA